MGQVPDSETRPPDFAFRDRGTVPLLIPGHIITPFRRRGDVDTSRANPAALEENPCRAVAAVLAEAYAHRV